MPSVGRTAYALGFAGLLPQAAAAVGVFRGGPDWVVYAVVVSFSYAAVILSFLGGIWWGFAMRRERGQAWLAALSVMPSLVAVALVAAMLAAGKAGIASEDYYLWAHLALGAALIATLPVDAHLARSGEAPTGWLRFRTALSVGLAALTVAAGWAYAANVRTETWV